MRQFVRGVVLVAVIGCLVAFFSVGSGGSAANGRQSSWISIGAPWPWYENRMEQEQRLDGGHSAFNEAGVIPNSPVWFLLVGAVVGVVGLWLTRALRSEVAPV